MTTNLSHDTLASKISTKIPSNASLEMISSRASGDENVFGDGKKIGQTYFPMLVTFLCRSEEAFANLDGEREKRGMGRAGWF